MTGQGAARRARRLPGVDAVVSTVFTDRTGGVSAPPYDSLNLGTHVGDDRAAVAENRWRTATRLGLDPDRVVWMDQVHGARVSVVDGPAAEPVPGTDGLVTDRPGLALAVLVADCVPVLLHDGAAGVVAAVHAGRKGVQSGVVPAALAAMAQLGASAATTVAELGPSICGECYEVPQAMADEVVAVVPAAAATTPSGTPGLDLRRGLAADLRARGVSVSRVGGCTAQEPTLYSHRRSGVTGRSAGLVWLS